MAKRPLTDRERDVAHLLARRFPDDAIAARLGIAPKTVRSHIDKIFAKLEIGSRHHVARALGIEHLGNEIPIPPNRPADFPDRTPAPLDGPPGDGLRPVPPVLIRGILAGPPRIAGSRLPVILGWTFLGLIALASAAGLGLAAYSSGDAIGRSHFAQAQGRSDEDQTSQPAPP